MKLPRSLLNQKLHPRGSFDYQFYAIAASLSLMSSLLVGADHKDFGQVFQLLIANVFAFGFLFLALLLIERGFSKRGPISFSIFLILGAVVGFAKGLLTGVGMALLRQGSDLQFEILHRVWQTTLIGLIAVPMIAMLGNLRLKFTNQRASLISEKVSRESSSGDGLESLKQFVSLARSKLVQLPAQAGSHALATRLREIVEQDLRPLSQKIWLRESLRLPQYRVGELIKVAVYRLVYKPHFVVLTFVLSSLISNLYFFGLQQGLAISILRGIFMFGLMWAMGRWKSKTLQRAWIKYSFFIASLLVGNELIAYLVSGLNPLPDQLGVICAYLIWLVQLTLLSGAAWAFFVLGQKVEVELTNLVGEDKVEELGAHTEAILRDRQLAQYLHGHLQSQLISTAIRLEDRSHEVSWQADLELVEKVLRESVEGFGLDRHESLQLAVEELRGNWEGLVALEVQIPNQEIPNTLIAKIYEVINEAITNAVRHGFASAVTIRLTKIDQGWEIEVSDNGVGPRSGAAGLGSAYFDSVSRFWTLEAAEPGALLRVVLEG